MKRSEKAILLNTLVLPGSGHFLFKRVLTGSVIVILTLVCFLFITLRVVRFTQLISQEINVLIEKGENLSVLGILGYSAKSFDFSSMGLATVCLLAIWLYSIIDIYRVGKLY